MCSAYPRTHTLHVVLAFNAGSVRAGCAGQLDVFGFGVLDVGGVVAGGPGVPRRRVGAGTVDSAGSLTHLAALRTGTQTDPIAGLLAELVQTANSATACFAEITSVMRSAESPAYNAA
jgi:hypothetical protein